jgi:hypothetical protein
MDPITTRGLIVGGAALFILLAATFMLAGLLEEHATDIVDDTYAPARETTVDKLGWPSDETSPSRDETEPAHKTNGPG